MRKRIFVIPCLTVVALLYLVPARGEYDASQQATASCSTTNLNQPFYVTSITQGTNGTTITWQSCPMFRYLVFSASQLSMNTPWASQSYASYIWGQPGASATSWTDLSTTNASILTQGFYKVQRTLGSLIAAGGSHSLAVTPDGRL